MSFILFSPSPVSDLHCQQFTPTHIQSLTHSLARTHTHTRTHTHSELTFSLSLFLSYTHSGSHTQWGPSFLSLCLSHTQIKREKHQQVSFSFWEWKINQFLSFSLSIIQFHNLDHNVSNLDDGQIADKTIYWYIFSFFNSYIVLNKLFILHSMYLSL